MESSDNQASRISGFLFNTSKSSSSSSSSAYAVLNLLSSLETLNDSSFIVGAAHDESSASEAARSLKIVTNSIRQCSATLATSLPFCSSLVIEAPSTINIQQIFAVLNDIGTHTTWTSEFSFPPQSTSSSANLQRFQASLFYLLHRTIDLQSFCIQGMHSLPNSVFHNDRTSSSRSCLISGLTQNDIHQKLNDLAATYYIVDDVEDGGESSSLMNASATAVFKRKKKGKSFLLTGEDSWRIGAHIVLDTIRLKLSSTSSNSSGSINNKAVPSYSIIANQTFPSAVVDNPVIETLSFEEENVEALLDIEMSSSSLNWLTGMSHNTSSLSMKTKSTIKHTVRVSGYLNHFLITKLVTILDKEDVDEFVDKKIVHGLLFLHPQSSHLQEKKKLLPLRTAELQLTSSSSLGRKQQQRGGIQPLINPFAVVTDMPRSTTQSLSEAASAQAADPTMPHIEDKIVIRFEAVDSPLKELAAIMNVEPELFTMEDEASPNELRFHLQVVEQLTISRNDENKSKAEAFELMARRSSIRLIKPSTETTRGKESQQDEDGITLDPMKKYEAYVDNSIF